MAFSPQANYTLALTSPTSGGRSVGIVSEEEQWVKIITDKKRSSYIEDYFEKSQNYCSTGDRTAELNIHLEDRFHKNCPT
jgi:hypothetical protein